VLPTALPGAVLNTEQAVIALLRLKTGRLQDEAAAAQLRSVAGREAAGQVDLGAYRAGLGKALVADHRGTGIWMLAEVEPVPVATAWAVALGLLVNELLTDSIRHAFPDGKGGSVLIAVRRAPEGGARVVVADDGIGLDPAFYPSGQDGATGMALIAALVRQAKAVVTVEGAPGTRVTLALPDHREVASAMRMRRRRGPPGAA
jgi:two-component sensor histidine kinase